MQYMALIYYTEGTHPTANPGDTMAAYGAFTQAVIASGQFVSGDALQPVSTATAVRVRDGKVLSTDGPFAETKEQLAGYYLLECKDLDEAIATAARIPHASVGTIEVRPVMGHRPG